LKKSSKDPPSLPAPLTLAAARCTLYPVEDLARAAGLSRRMMNQMLKGAGVAIVRGRRMHFVSLAEFQAKLPAFWDSIVHVDAMRRAGLGDDA
jgi:hypothetical protein